MPTPGKSSSSNRKPREGGKYQSSRKPRQEGEKPRFERKSRSDSDKPRFERKPRTEGDKPKFERKPRTEGDKPRFERKPRAEGDKPRFERKPRTEGDKPRYERKSRAEGDKPRFERKSRTEGDKPRFERKPRAEGDKQRFERKPRTEGDKPRFERKLRTEGDKPRFEKKPYGAYRPGAHPKATSRPQPEGEFIRLNKFIANAGVCSRREADELIQAGAVTVNGEVVTILGTKVRPTDKIQYGDQTLHHEKKRYLLLNKPKGYITTTKDTHDRKTVMVLIEGACRERLYPVGRLDRNTSGLLMFTNDGDLAKKLTHPKSRVVKTYHVVLDQPLSKSDMQKLADGIELEGKKFFIDTIAYDTESNDKREIGLEIHSGQNRVVRRLFEAIGYKVTKLDRTFFAGLTKKNLPRGHWRFLEEREVNRLMML